MIQKWFQIYIFSTASSISIFTATLIFAPSSLAEPPSTDWKTRYTGLKSQGQCFRRAERGMRYYSFRNIETSGNTGIYGEYQDIGAYILCRENGSQAYIFCAGFRAYEICERLSRYMED